MYLSFELARNERKKNTVKCFPFEFRFPAIISAMCITFDPISEPPASKSNEKYLNMENVSTFEQVPIDSMSKFIVSLIENI